MATFRKLPSGKWQAQVARLGVRRSRSFDTKIEARDWAAQTEFELKHEKKAEFPQKTFMEVCHRYSMEVSTTKRGIRWELMRLDKMANSKLGQKMMDDIAPSDIALWRDERLAEVSPGTVLRELTLLTHVFNVARREWGWTTSNPVSEVRKPSAPPPRDRRILEDEIERILFVAGYQEDGKIVTTTQRVVVAFLFAIETAMRAGEIIGLTWNDVNLNTRVAKLGMTKNGFPRNVPLSGRAIELLDKLPRHGGACFNLKSSQLDALFRKIRDKAGIDNLHFHDTRHEAITRLSKKLDVLALARMVGHRDLKMLQVYYNESAEDLAKRLD